MRGAAPAEPAADNLLRPSDPAAGEGHPRPIRRNDPAAGAALLRGTLVHRLLQSLPDVVAEGRRDAALRYLARNAGDWSEAEREALAGRMLALVGIRALPRYCAGQPGRGLDRRQAGAAGRPPALVSGQIDRLAVTATEVLIVDYKTNYAPPAALAGARHRLCPAAGALPGGLAEALSPVAGPRRAALDRNP